MLLFFHIKSVQLAEQGGFYYVATTGNAWHDNMTFIKVLNASHT